MFGLGQSQRNFDVFIRRLDVIENVTGNIGPRMATQESMMRDVTKKLSSLENRLDELHNTKIIFDDVDA